ncbi:MAG: sulfotransferase domain-containing protein [Thermodesulfobacteriota bacterium]
MVRKLGQAFQKAFGPRSIIQFSPPRSGSTLVFNILREVLPGRKIEKTHNYNPKFSRHKVVVTFRHPLDSIASGIQRYGRTPSGKEIEVQIKEFSDGGIWDVLKIRHNPNVLMLKYEKFYNNFDYVFDNLETFLSIEINRETRKQILDKYNIEAVSERVQQFDGFQHFDAVTHWHGNHISPYKGGTDYYKKFFSQEQVDYLKKVYREFLVAFDYE